MYDVASQYVRIHTDHQTPHNKTIMYPTGFLPCKFVKIKCVRGTPSSMFEVNLVGVLERIIWRSMGPEMGSLIVEHPESLLLPAKPHLAIQATRTFPAHQSIMNEDGPDSYNENDVSATR